MAINDVAGEWVYMNFWVIIFVSGLGTLKPNKPKKLFSKHLVFPALVLTRGFDLSTSEERRSRHDMIELFRIICKGYSRTISHELFIAEGYKL